MEFGVGHALEGGSRQMRVGGVRDLTLGDRGCAVAQPATTILSRTATLAYLRLANAAFATVAVGAICLLRPMIPSAHFVRRFGRRHNGRKFSLAKRHV
eukprot:CAMPEP_0119499078 /NCGR_PEP_ID=MMETSP1344-20130328/21651_1 /TAXON_ID=236787 /ORGANISM="Florenciella parvula, Strain CCMP2471" /LENGTH=97 /DNA_ID=CAMNT_0007535029 /DNA_START=184 /DNA_END=477 /DNA_ORIENTATION=-